MKNTFKRMASSLIESMALLMDVDDDMLDTEPIDDGYRDFWGIAAVNEPLWQCDMQLDVPAARVVSVRDAGSEPKRRHA